MEKNRYVVNTSDGKGSEFMIHIGKGRGGHNSKHKLNLKSKALESKKEFTDKDRKDQYWKHLLKKSH
jgi:hypothetical protein